MKLVLVACGTALATSTVVARKIEQIAQENGIECKTVQARAVDTFSKYQELHPDAIVCTCQLEGEIDAPIINGRAFLTGINLQSTIDQLIGILKK
ncbi:PTS sugar transporter subunit IIB [Acetobacterium tundrae]|uniref:PTS galactitol transporter subunit IIB n=1 Tax=Acetobacterium tundrae TaxID=132932 RepID=A0ABR6WMV3_9FIRM|nr:PTS galactitol transporter subunit IIB [Acetobacterium tundrae]MBC3797774.1 PTS galactitol transporter subunit IIB [Acetobacterium tundrae]